MENDGKMTIKRYVAELKKEKQEAASKMFELSERIHALDKILKTIDEGVGQPKKVLPTADVIERKRGRWKITNKYKDRRSGRVVDRIECTACGKIEHRAMGEMLPKFCPNCGADMRGEDNE